MKLSHPHGFEQYCEKYSELGRFEDLLTLEGMDFVCVVAEFNEMTTGICTNEQAKVIFRSNWPSMPHIKRNIEAIVALPLPSGAAETILVGNAARLLGHELLFPEVLQRKPSSVDTNENHY